MAELVEAALRSRGLLLPAVLSFEGHSELREAVAAQLKAPATQLCRLHELDAQSSGGPPRKNSQRTKGKQRDDAGATTAVASCFCCLRG